MGTTAEKLTYLNETKGKIKDSINLTGAGITNNDTFRSYATKLRDGLLDIINNGTATLYNNFPKVSGTGSNISLSNTLEASMNNNKFDGDTYQQTYTGKNLIPTQADLWEQGTISSSNGQNSSSTTRIRTIDYYKIKNDTNYYVSIQDINYVFLNLLFYDENKNYIEAYHTYDRRIDGATSLKINIPSSVFPNVAYYRATIKKPNDTTITASEIISIKPQIELGESATSWEQYVGGTASPNSLFPQNIQSVEGIQNVSIIGKNLLPFTNQDFTYKNVRYYVQNGNLYLDGTSTGETGVNITEFKENFSFTLSAGTYVFNRGQNGDAVSLPSYIRKYSDNSTLATNWGKFTLQEETKVFLGFYIYNKTFDNNFIDIQLEKGDSVITYEEHKEQTYEVNLEGKNLFDGVVEQGEFNSSGNINTSTTTRNYSVNYIPVKPSTQYVSNYNLNRVCFYDENKTFISRSSSYNFKTFTTLSNAYYIRFDISTDYDTNTLQLEKGSTSTSYVPYRSPIKLYNGDYITGTPDNWSIYKENGTYNINTSQISLIESYSNLEYASFPKASDFIGFGSYDKSEVISNKAIWTSSTSWNNAENIGKISGNANQWNWWLGFTKGTGLTTIQQELADTIIIYKLATPTTTPITDTYLISQLNALYNAKSYEGQTNISVSGQLPMILEVSALKDEI